MSACPVMIVVSSQSRYLKRIFFFCLLSQSSNSDEDWLNRGGHCEGNGMGWRIGFGDEE